MKLRIKGNSVRLRLSQSEVELVALGAEVKEYVHFAENQFGYALRQEAIDSIEARYENNSMLIVLPYVQGKKWAKSDEVGISARVGELQILIEKDFQCLVSRGEEDKDAFPNPLAK